MLMLLSLMLLIYWWFYENETLAGQDTRAWAPAPDWVSLVPLADLLALAPLPYCPSLLDVWPQWCPGRWSKCSSEVIMYDCNQSRRLKQQSLELFALNWEAVFPWLFSVQVRDNNLNRIYVRVLFLLSCCFSSVFAAWNPPVDHQFSVLLPFRFFQWRHSLFSTVSFYSLVSWLHRLPRRMTFWSPPRVGRLKGRCCRCWMVRSEHFWGFPTENHLWGTYDSDLHSQ